MRTQRVGHRSASAGDETITEINVTPLVDVVLVLLVVLMVAAGVIAQRSLPIVLPAEGPPDASPPPRIEILLDAGGHASVAGAPVTDADLRARVRQMVATSPRERSRPRSPPTAGPPTATSYACSISSG